MPGRTVPSRMNKSFFVDPASWFSERYWTSVAIVGFASVVGSWILWLRWLEKRDSRPPLSAT